MTALEEIKKAEHERIWLEPAGAPDRCWCQDNQWGDEGVEYVLASTLESLQRENEELVSRANEAVEAANALQVRADIAEAEVTRLQAEIDRKSSMPGDHRYWEGRYRDEAAENDKLRELLKPFATEAENWHDSVPDDHRTLCTEPNSKTAHPGSEADFTVGDLRRARTALASTGGEHHAD